MSRNFSLMLCFHLGFCQFDLTDSKAFPTILMLLNKEDAWCLEQKKPEMSVRAILTGAKLIRGCILRIPQS